MAGQGMKYTEALRQVSLSSSLAGLAQGAPGWVRDTAGDWLFIHAGGAISARESVPGDAGLHSWFARYELPAAPDGTQALREAAGHSTGLVRELPPQAGAVLAGLAYRAAISRLPCTVILTGPSRTGKTSAAQACLDHFAPCLQAGEVPALRNQGFTEAALAKRLHLNRDVLTVADQAGGQVAASAVYMQQAGSGKTRLTPSGAARLAEPPRGSLLVCAETVPPSAHGHALLVPLAQGEISAAACLALGKPSARHSRAAALASFITWQAGRREETLERLAALTREYTVTWTDAGYAQPCAGVLAALAGGWRLFLDHLADRGAFTAAEAGQLWQKAWSGLAGTALYAGGYPDPYPCPRCGYPETVDAGPYEPSGLDTALGPVDPEVHLMWCGRCGKPFDAGPARHDP
jgi:hypothetical protein